MSREKIDDRRREEEIDDVVAFFESLTDPRFLEDPRFSDPGDEGAPAP
jgi:hypothetical protein